MVYTKRPESNSSGYRQYSQTPPACAATRPRTPSETIAIVGYPGRIELGHRFTQGKTAYSGKFRNDGEAFRILVVTLFEEIQKLFSAGLGKGFGIAPFAQSEIFAGLLRRKQGLQTQKQERIGVLCGRRVFWKALLT